MKKVTSCIKSENGAQYLYVNGQKADSVAYITYLAENNRYGDFAKAGYRVYSISLFFGTNNLNEFANSRSFSKGIFDEDEPYFAELDANINRIVSVCPDAMILPRVNVNLSEKWEAEHPDELCDKTRNDDPSHRRPCIASDVWAAEVKRLLTLFVEHIETASYVNNIIGYQIAGGNTEEWLSYDGDAFSGKRSKEKFANLVKENKYPDTEDAYYQFLSDITADRVCELAAHVKELTQRRLVVGSFYGYVVGSPSRFTPHSALHRMLQSDDIDFICSPVSYNRDRAPGFHHAYGVPIHSLKLHNKLYFSENDTRTHLSRALNDTPYYQKPVWFGPEKPMALNILKMHFARMLIYGHASWWFDMWGGWYADEAYMNFMKQAREIALSANGARSVTEVAIFVDEYANAKGVTKEARALCAQTRYAMGLMGAPFDLYLAEDFEQVKDQYKAYVSMAPVPTKGSDAIAAYAADKHIPLLEITPESHELTAADMRDFCTRSGVFLYTDKKAVVYASKEYLFLHAAADGEILLRTPEGERLTEVFTGKTVNGSLTVKLGDSLLFKRC